MTTFISKAAIENSAIQATGLLWTQSGFNSAEFGYPSQT